MIHPYSRCGTSQGEGRIGAFAFGGRTSVVAVTYFFGAAAIVIVLWCFSNEADESNVDQDDGYTVVLNDVCEMPSSLQSSEFSTTSGD